MEKIFEAVTSIPTPLALGGLIVGGLIIIFLALLKMEIFPKLSKELGEKTISRLMLYLFILALVGLLLGFLGYILPLLIDEGIRGNKNSNVNSAPIATATPSINIIRDGTTLETALNTLAKREGRGSAHFKSNCSDSVKKSILNKGEVTAPDIARLMFKLQYNLVKPVSTQAYDVSLTQEEIYEIDCKY